MAAVEAKASLFIEKPLATDIQESAKILSAIEEAGLNAVMGYTQRFRRRFFNCKTATSRR